MNALWHKPRSTCKCGHLGDGPASEHGDDRFEAGHGACNVSTCSCLQFTWAGFTPEFMAHMSKLQAKDEGGAA